MNGIDSYHVFMAMRLHFNQKKFSYLDVFGKKTKVSITRERWQELPERMKFESFGGKFANEEHMLEFLIPAFVNTPDLYIWDVMSEWEKFKGLSHSWVKRRAQKYHFFKNDLDLLFRDMNTLNINLRDFLFGGMICDWLVKDKISMETFIILNKLTKFLQNSSDHGILYGTFYDLTVTKYSLFLTVDLDRYGTIFTQQIQYEKERRQNMSGSK